MVFVHLQPVVIVIVCHAIATDGGVGGVLDHGLCLAWIHVSVSVLLELVVWKPLCLDPSDGVFGRFDLAALCSCHTLNVCCCCFVLVLRGCMKPCLAMPACTTNCLGPGLVFIDGGGDKPGLYIQATSV